MKRSSKRGERINPRDLEMRLLDDQRRGEGAYRRMEEEEEDEEKEEIRPETKEEEQETMTQYRARKKRENKKNRELKREKRERTLMGAEEGDTGEQDPHEMYVIDQITRRENRRLEREAPLADVLRRGREANNRMAREAPQPPPPPNVREERRTINNPVRDPFEGYNRNGL